MKISRIDSVELMKDCSGAPRMCGVVAEAPRLPVGSLRVWEPCDLSRHLPVYPQPRLGHSTGTPTSVESRVCARLRRQGPELRVRGELPAPVPRSVVTTHSTR